MADVLGSLVALGVDVTYDVARTRRASLASMRTRTADDGHTWWGPQNAQERIGPARPST